MLQGDYESFRQFIYALESAPQFVIIDDVTLAQTDPTKPLTLIARAVHLLPAGSQWQLSAAGRLVLGVLVVVLVARDRDQMWPRHVRRAGAVV